MIINTTDGPMDETLLDKEETSEPVPCGDCVTTSFYLGERLVRRDVEIKVKRSALIQGAAGRN